MFDQSGCLSSNRFLYKQYKFNWKMYAEKFGSYDWYNKEQMVNLITIKLECTAREGVCENNVPR